MRGSTQLPPWSYSVRACEGEVYVVEYQRPDGAYIQARLAPEFTSEHDALHWIDTAIARAELELEDYNARMFE